MRSLSIATIPFSLIQPQGSPILSRPIYICPLGKEWRTTVLHSVSGFLIEIPYGRQRKKDFRGCGSLTLSLSMHGLAGLHTLRRAFQSYNFSITSVYT